MPRSWQQFWQTQTKPLHQIDSQSFYIKHSSELNVLTGPVDGRSVLELGCGDGALYRHLGFDRASKYIGVDFSSAMLEGFRRQEPDVDVRQGDAIDIPASESFDLAFSNGLVQYFDHEQFCQHLTAVLQRLNRGGLYVCGSIPAKERFPSLLCGSASYPPAFSFYRSVREGIAYAIGRSSLGQWYSLRDIQRATSRVGAVAETFGSLCYLYRYHAVFRAAG